MKSVKNDNYYVVYGGVRYAFDFAKFEEMYIPINMQDNREKEITETYSVNEENEMELSAKINREIKSNGIPQNKLLSYDIMKMFVERLLDNDSTQDDVIDTGTSLALNSLIKIGVLVEV